MTGKIAPTIVQVNIRPEARTTAPSSNGSKNTGSIRHTDSSISTISDACPSSATRIFTILMVSNGTPMFCAGDEFMNTQRGNNNPWNQDNGTTWLDWDLLEKNSDMFRFFKGMIAFRKAHPSLARSRFWREDVNWYGVNGSVDLGNLSHSLAFCLHGVSQQDQDIYVMINAYWQDLNFEIQEGKAGDWNCVADTGMSSPFDFSEVGQEKSVTSLSYAVKAR